MNISKKALMSVLMALTSLVAMAQPYYHVMKQDGGKLTEKATYDGQTYKVKIDMEKPVEKPEEVKPEEVKPECAIGNKITIPSCGLPYRSFYFTNKGNVYYDASKRKFFFEESQLDYPSYNNYNHWGLFRWGRSIDECVGKKGTEYSEYNPPRAKDFYFANPANLPKLQEDLGNEKWTVPTSCEWYYIREHFGEGGWTIDGQICYLIDTTPGKSLLRTIEEKNGDKTMSKEDFFEYEALGLVALPACGSLAYFDSGVGTPFRLGTEGKYWVCSSWGDDYYYYYYETSSYRTKGFTSCFYITQYGAVGVMSDHDSGMAVRLLILAD